MSECCSAKDKADSPPRDAVCPENGKRYKQVKRKTLLHHVTQPWQRQLTEQVYYYCDDPECNVVYFSQHNDTIRSSELRLSTEERMNTICFCFDVLADDLKTNEEQCKSFVLEQTKNSTCDCEIRNPSGKCCLKDFPKFK